MKAFEEFISKAKGAVDIIGEKAGQFVDVSKQNLKLIDLKSQLKSEFEALGKVVYENYGKDNDENPELASRIQSIKLITEEIEKLKIQIAFTKNKILCKSCGHNNEVGSLYCAKCGENLKKGGTPIIDEEKESSDDDFAEFDD